MNNVKGKEVQKTGKTISKLNKILVAIDGSEISDKALNFALNLGQTVNAEIEVLTVTQNLILPWVGVPELRLGVSHPRMTGPGYLSDYYADQKKYSREIVEKAVKKAEQDYPELKVSKKIASGYPANEIVEEAQNGFDLVVVGSRGHGFIDELILGSVSKKVVDISSVSVLVVK
jgi:nucleotide-binding universal stress UspA family protein